MVEKRNARVLSLVHAPRGLRVMGFRLFDRAKIVVNQIDRAYDEFQSNHFVGHRGYSL